MKLLTDQEVAELLRCSASAVKRLRLSGEIPYLPGRPPRIDMIDLEEFVEANKRRKEAERPTILDSKDPAVQARVAWFKYQARLKEKARKAAERERSQG